MADPKVDNLPEFGDNLEPQGELSKQAGTSIPDAAAVKKLESELDSVKKELRGLQGRQDKSTSAFQTFLDEYEAQKAKGLNNADAAQAAESTLNRREKAEKQEKLLEQIAQKLGLDSSSPLVSGSTKGIATDYEKVIKAHGLDANDSEIISMMRESESALDFSIKASQLAQRKQSAPTPNSAQSPSKVFEPQPPQSNIELIGEYRKTMMANRGRTSDLQRIKAEYAQKGVPVDDVIFT
jgi:hypothetical protein